MGKSAVGSGREWCKAVLSREKQTRKVTPKAAEDVNVRPQSADGLASRASVMKEKASRMAAASRRNDGEGFPVMPSTPSSRQPRDVPGTPQTAPQQGRVSERRKQVRSMMF